MVPPFTKVTFTALMINAFIDLWAFDSIPDAFFKSFALAFSVNDFSDFIATFVVTFSDRWTVANAFLGLALDL